jgi:predicted DNA-binding transcriptional regulator YafY
MKASRLLSILMLLQTHGRLTAGALAAEMEVSVRTILRDIDQLSAAGVPLYGDRGRNGGFQLRTGWSTALTGMTEPEAQALLLAGLPGPATELGLGTAAASARLKLVASLPSEWRAQAERVGARLHIDPIDWYRAEDTPRHLREMADAVWQARRVRVHYDSWRGAVWRELEPLGLVLKAGAWYLIARAAGRDAELRTYRLASVIGLTVGTEAFERPPGFDLARTWRASAARFEAELRPLQARVRVSARALKWFANGRTPHSVIRADDSGAEVLMPIESIEHGARQLLGFGAEVEAVEPPELRAEMQAQAGALARLYGVGVPRAGRNARTGSRP